MASKSNRPKKGKDGKYHKQAYIGKGPDGTRIYRRFSDTDWHNLILQIAQCRADFQSGKLLKEEQEAKNPTPSLATAMENYIDTCRVVHQQNPEEYSVATIAGYASVCRSIRKSPAFAQIIDKPVSELTVGALQAALNAASFPDADGKKLSPKTLRNWWGLLKPAIDTYGPQDIRLDKIKIAKGKSAKPLVISNRSIPEMFRIALEIDTEFFLYIFFTAMLGTRPSESYAFTWGDVSAEPMTSISDGKVRQFGTINIDKASVRDEFGKYREKKTKSEAGTRSLSRPWAFFETLYSTKPRGKDDERIISMNPNQLPYRWKKLKERMSLPENMVLYDLRHYHASAMAACGATDAYIASDMGHADIAITRKHYLEEIEETRQEINDRMFTHTETMILQFRGGNATQNTTQNANKSSAV